MGSKLPHYDGSDIERTKYPNKVELSAETLEALQHWTLGLGDLNKRNEREPLPQPMIRALADTWGCFPPSDDVREIPIALALTGKEFERLAWGHIPEAMEDHWFMYFDGEGFRYYRSWTGAFVYKVFVTQEPGQGYLAYKAMVDSGAMNSPNTDEQDRAIIKMLIKSELGHDVSDLWDTICSPNAS